MRQGDYGRIGHLLDEDNLYLPMLRSALEVYVDDEALRSAFVMSRLGWACFLGEEDCGGFREEVLEVVRRQPGGRYWFGGAPFWRGGGSALTRRHTAAAGGEAEVDIQTGEAHRRRGCALALCKAFIARCLEEGLLPKWDCQLGNGASNRLAEKLGSVPVGKYPLLYIK